MIGYFSYEYEINPNVASEYDDLTIRFEFTSRRTVPDDCHLYIEFRKLIGRFVRHCENVGIPPRMMFLNYRKSNSHELILYLFIFKNLTLGICDFLGSDCPRKILI